MKSVVIPNLTQEQAEAVTKAIMYHLTNEGLYVNSDVVPAATYAERAQPELPDGVNIEIR
jgi:hypothetical protein